MRRGGALALALAVALAPMPVFAKALESSPLPLSRPKALAPNTAPTSPQAPTPAGPVATPGGVALPTTGSQSLMAAPPAPAPAPDPQKTGPDTAPLADPGLALFRPKPRPVAPQAEAAPEAPPAADPALAGFRPKPRPGTLAPPETVAAEPPAILAPANPQLAGHRPLPRPEGLAVPAPDAGSSAPAPETAALPPAPEAQKPPPGGVLGRIFKGSRKKPAPKSSAPEPEASLRGSVCGVAGLIGKEVAPIGNRSRGSGCGVAEPVQITSVSGIKLSQPMTVDCGAATAFKRWVDRGIVPAVGGKGGGVAKLDVGPGYVCRPRNGVRGAKLSEHGHGKAIDLMGLTLKNGQSLDVEQGWRSQPRILRAMHSSACGIFGTVLGPQSDSYHRDHIHVDTARYRSGTYCR